MSDQFTDDFASDADRTPLPAGKLSSNGQWIFGSIFAGFLLVGFSFGVWAGVSKPKAVEKPTEVAEAKKEEKSAPVAVKPVEPKPKEKEPVVEPKKELELKKETEPKKETEIKPEIKKEADPKPKETEPKKVDFKSVSFKEIEPVFRTYCNNCHGSVGKPKGGVDLRTIAAIMKGKDGEAIVKVGDPEKSLLYQTMKPPTATMPPDGKQGPNEKELKLVYDWIGSGAKPRRTVRRRR